MFSRVLPLYLVSTVVLSNLFAENKHFFVSQKLFFQGLVQGVTDSHLPGCQMGDVNLADLANKKKSLSLSLSLSYLNATARAEALLNSCGSQGRLGRHGSSALGDSSDGSNALQRCEEGHILGTTGKVKGGKMTVERLLKKTGELG